MSTFYKKRMNKVLIPTLFWSAIFILYLYIYRDFSAFNMVGALLKGKPFYHLWFMYAIIGLYIFVPFFRILLANLTSFEFRWLILLIFIFSIGHNYISFYFENQRTLFPSFLSYIGYFLLGYELYKYTDKVTQFRSFLLSGFIISLILTVVVNAVFKDILLQIKVPIIAYFSPLIAIQAITLFMYVVGSSFSFKYPKILVHLSATSFGIYLVYPLLS